MDHHGIAQEHPYCDRLSMVFAVTFFFVWSVDTFLFYTTGHSTVLFGLFPGVFFAAVCFVASVYLILKSHSMVLGHGRRVFVDSNVYSWVRHPMYLGMLLFLLGFLLISFSLASLVIWILAFLAFDRMTVYEEGELVKKVKRYRNYQKRVGKWFPHI